MKLDSTFTIPLKCYMTAKKSRIKKNGFLNITFDVGMNPRQISKAFFYLSLHAFWLAVKHLFKRSDSG